MLGRAPARLIDAQDSSIEHAVAQRLLAQRGKAGARFLRNDPAAAGAVIEIFEDHPGIVERGPVVQNEHRNFAERILPAHAVGGIDGVGRLDLHGAIEPEHAGGNSNLTAERGGVGGAQDHRGNPIVGGALARA